MVYDLGGGTFDVSIIEMGDGVTEVLATNGDTHLGGDDFDQRIIDWMADAFQTENGIDLRKDKMAAQRLKEAAEKAKIELSSAMSSQINLPFITADATGPKHLDMTLTRAKFNELTADLVDRTMTPVRKALQEKIHQLEKAGCSPIVLLCTGEFEGLTTEKVRLIEPDRLLPPVFAALLNPLQVGVMVPLIEQAQSELNKWKGLDKPPVFAAASPYTASKEELQEAARKLAHQGAEVIVLDCMGYSKTLRDICAEAVDVPVIASSTMVAELTANLL